MSISFQPVNLQQIATDLAAKSGKQPRQSGGEWTTHCPIHPDDKGSLCLTEKDGKLLVNCQAGCNQDQVFDEVIKLSGLSRRNTTKKEVAIYQYQGTDGKVVFEKVRYEPKDFRTRRPDGNGNYVWNTKDVDTTVPYRLPEVLQAIQQGEPIYIVEGEKDVDNLRNIGLVATCNLQGASKDNAKPKWTDKHTAWLEGLQQAIIIPDNDDAGKAHARSVAVSLDRKGIKSKIVEIPNLPDKGDASDWLQSGGEKDQLLKLANDVQTWTGASCNSPLEPSATTDDIELALKDIAQKIADGTFRRGDHRIELELKKIKQTSGLTLQALKTSVYTLAKETKPVITETFDDPDLTAAVQLLMSENLFAEFDSDFKLTGYKADEDLTTTGLLMLGRTLLPASSALYGYGNASSGKSKFLQDIVEFYLQSRVVRLTTITPKFLYRAGGEDGKGLKHKFLLFGEMRPLRPGEDDQMQEAIRQFISENHLELGSVDDMDGQSNVANIKRVEGPVTIAFTGTFSPSDWDDQIITRSFCQQFKHTHDSIKHVLFSKATSGLISSNPLASDVDKLGAAKRKWQAAWLLLQRLDPADPDAFFGIEIPFLEQLVFKKTKLGDPDMRAFEMLKSCIAVSTLLHQKARTVRQECGRNILVATWTDYEFVKASFLKTMPRTSQGISNDLIEKFSEVLVPWWTDPDRKFKSMSAAQIAKALNAPETTARRCIRAWLKADLLEEADTANAKTKNSKKYYQLAGDAESLATTIKESGDPILESESPPSATVRHCPPQSAWEAETQQETAFPDGAPLESRKYNTAISNCDSVEDWNDL